MRMPFPLPGAHHFEDATLSSALKAAATLGLPEQVARRIVTQVVMCVPKAVAELNAELGKTRMSSPPGARAALAADARLLDVVERIILRNMLARPQTGGRHAHALIS